MSLQPFSLGILGKALFNLLMKLVILSAQGSGQNDNWMIKLIPTSVLFASGPACPIFQFFFLSRFIQFPSICRRCWPPSECGGGDSTMAHPQTWGNKRGAALQSYFGWASSVSRSKWLRRCLVSTVLSFKGCVDCCLIFSLRLRPSWHTWKDYFFIITYLFYCPLFVFLSMEWLCFATN